MKVLVLKNYMGIVLAFFLGSLISLLMSPVLGKFYGIEGALTGYVIGQLFILIILLYNILKQFPFNGFYNGEFLRYFRIFPFIMIMLKTKMNI